MDEIKEKQVESLYKELLFYDEDLYKLSRILVKTLPSKFISRIITKLSRIKTL